jgi:hypothetical protein
VLLRHAVAVALSVAASSSPERREKTDRQILVGDVRLVGTSRTDPRLGFQPLRILRADAIRKKSAPVIPAGATRMRCRGRNRNAELSPFFVAKIEAKF